VLAGLLLLVGNRKSEIYNLQFRRRGGEVGRRARFGHKREIESRRLQLP
jgi:hypothetical protein